jgi:hypothetical protein
MPDIDKIIDEAKSCLLPFESWERLPGESGAAFSAFCAFRDCGLERNIRKAVEGQFRKAELPTEFSPTAKTPHPNLETAIAKKYRVWRNWSTQFRWRERAADFDRYTERLRQEEMRKTIEAQGEMHRQVTGKMLEVVKKKLEAMNPDDLSQGSVTEWVQTAIKAEREASNQRFDGLVTSNGKAEPKQGELSFVSDFNGV